MVRVIIIISGFILAFSAFAWTPNGENTTISQVWQWQNNGDILFKTASGHKCYIPSNEEKMYSFILSMYISQKEVSVHCHDGTTSIGGQDAHRVHRVIAL